MAKYTKKPVEIEAIQWVSSNIAEIEEFVGKKLKSEWVGGAGYEAGVAPPLIDLIIPTLEGDMRASYGDYIIKGINGEFYPCKPDIFLKTYDKVDESRVVPNNVYKFEIVLNPDLFPYVLFTTTIATKIIWSNGWERKDEWDNDEEKIREAYFGPEKIEAYKEQLIKDLRECPNPFLITCNDTDGDYNFTEDQLFRNPEKKININEYYQ